MVYYIHICARQSSVAPSYSVSWYHESQGSNAELPESATSVKTPRNGLVKVNMLRRSFCTAFATSGRTFEAFALKAFALWCGFLESRARGGCRTNRLHRIADMLILRHWFVVAAFLVSSSALIQG